MPVPVDDLDIVQRWYPDILPKLMGVKATAHLSRFIRIFLRSWKTMTTILNR